MNIISRLEASKKGLKYYYTGVPCKNGHVSKRVTSKWTCYECEKMRNRISSKTDHAKKLKKISRKKYKKGKGIIITQLRRRYSHYLERNYVLKNNSITKYIGTTPQGLRYHIENQFDEKMNWENYGKYWVIDHIVPMAFFDLNKENHKKLCLNYNNIQPLEKMKNSYKQDKFNQSDLVKLINVTGITLD